jgi:hypothetical protein
MKKHFKIIIDVFMMIILLLLMTYSLIGKMIHEYIGVILFILFIIHHFFNRKWLKNIFKIKHSSFHTLQVILVILLVICVLSSFISGMILSKYIFHLSLSKSLARKIHMLSAYWGFILMSIHLGIHSFYYS